MNTQTQPTAVSARTAKFRALLDAYGVSGSENYDWNNGDPLLLGDPISGRAYDREQRAIDAMIRSEVIFRLNAEKAALLAALDEIEDASGNLMSRVEGDGLTVDQIASYLVEIQNQARAAISRAKGQA